MNIKAKGEEWGKDGWEYFYQGTANLQPGCAAPRWSRADWVSITNVSPFTSALNQSELEFSGLISIFFSLQNLALFSTNSMPCSKNCKSNERRCFLNRFWDALNKAVGHFLAAPAWTVPGSAGSCWVFPFLIPRQKHLLKRQFSWHAWFWQVMADA